MGDMSDVLRIKLYLNSYLFISILDPLGVLSSAHNLRDSVTRRDLAGSLTAVIRMPNLPLCT